MVAMHGYADSLSAAPSEPTTAHSRSCTSRPLAVSNRCQSTWWKRAEPAISGFGGAMRVTNGAGGGGTIDADALASIPPFRGGGGPALPQIVEEAEGETTQGDTTAASTGKTTRYAPLSLLPPHSMGRGGRGRSPNRNG